MGRSRNRRNGTGDALEEASSVTMSVHETDQNIVLDGFIDALYEKRANVREEGFKGLLNALQNNVLTEFVYSKYETLLRLCISSVKKGGSSEIMYASQVLGLIAVTAGFGSVSRQILSEASSHLIKAAKLGSDSRARSAALRTLALICFLGSSGEDVTEDVMCTLWQISRHKGNYHSDQALGMNRPSSDVKAAALSAWTFLLVDIPHNRILSHYMAEFLPMLTNLLENDDLAIRISAGEAIAAIFEARNTVQCVEYDDFSTKGLFSCLAKEDNGNEAKVVEQVKGVAYEAGGKGQANKKSQRSSFRDILSVIEGRVVPYTPLKLQKGDSFSPKSWAQRTQLKFLTSILAEGLQKHLQENTLLHQVFHFAPFQEKQPALTSKEKRIYMSPNSIQSKERTQLMNRMRSESYACRVGHFMFENE